MSNPSPEPSAESLAEAREVLMRTPWPYTEGDIRKVALALDAAKRSSRREALGQAAMLHENIDPACDHEIQGGHPGAGAMAAIINYRDSIRALPEKP